MVSPIDLLAGALTIAPLVIGYTMSIITLKKYLDNKSSLVLVTAILFFALPSPWLGVSSVFVLSVLNQKPLDTTTYVFLYAWSVPIILTAWNYTAVSILKFKKAFNYIIMSLSVIIDILFMYSIYISKDFEVNQVEGSIFYDSTFFGIASLLATISVVSILLFVGPLFIWVSVKTEDKLLKFKARFIALGAMLFSLGAGIDANIELSNVGIIIVIRLMIVLSLIALFLGYNTPQSIKSRYT